MTDEKPRRKRWRVRLMAGGTPIAYGEGAGIGRGYRRALTDVAPGILTDYQIAVTLDTCMTVARRVTGLPVDMAEAVTLRGLTVEIERIR